MLKGSECRTSIQLFLTFRRSQISVHQGAVLKSRVNCELSFL